LTIEHVAEQSGFASVRDFRRVWRRYHAVSPSEFRLVIGTAVD
jgi:AraC-like DNA-binding protein